MQIRLKLMSMEESRNQDQEIQVYEGVTSPSEAELDYEGHIDLVKYEDESQTRLKNAERPLSEYVGIDTEHFIRDVSDMK